MILDYYKLREQPFGVTPDPRYLYASGTHREALASLLYGIDSGLGFVTLTANPGMGKTTLLFEVLRRLGDSARTAFIFQTVTSPDELVRALLIDLGVPDVKSTLVEMQAQLNERLIAESSGGKRLVVAIDEAQNLNESVLEAVRMLSNFETASQKLMQIILAGQLQLAETLASPKMLQLRQRISIFSHLKPLSASETNKYVQHRLRISGYDSAEPLFTAAAIELVAKESGGVPRTINNICFNALSLGYALQKATINAEVIREVLRDLDIGLIHNLATESAQTAQMVPDRVFSPTAISTVRRREAPAKKQWKIKLFGITAIACLTALLLAWVGVRQYRTVSAETTVVDAPTPAAAQKPLIPDSIPDPAPRPATAADAAPVRLQNPVGSDDSSISSTVRWVEVREGQSLFTICVLHFGVCRPEIWKQIISMNTSIPDRDSIHSGQKVAIPVRMPASDQSNTKARR